MIPVETYLEIEELALAPLRKNWKDFNDYTQRRLKSATDPVVHDQVIERMNPRGVYFGSWDALAKAGTLALLFGSTRLVDPKDSMFAKSKFPEAVRNSLGLMKATLPQVQQDLQRRLREVPQSTDFTKSAGVDLVEQSFLDGEKAIKTGGALFVSRLASMGFLAQAMKSNVSTYRINEVMDLTTCPVCRHVDGMVFDVGPSHDLLKGALASQDPLTVKHAMTWPSQSTTALSVFKAMSPTQIADAGWSMPPYHPGCRGILDRA
jgi:hypothetical protein